MSSLSFIKIPKKKKKLEGGEKKEKKICNQNSEE